MNTDLCIHCGFETSSPSAYFCSEDCRLSEFAKASTTPVPSSPAPSTCFDWSDTMSTSSKRSSISSSPSLTASSLFYGSTPTDWFASRPARSRSLAGTVTAEEPEVYPFELEAPAISYKAHVHGPKYYFDPDGVDPTPSDSTLSSPSDFRMAGCSPTTGQQAAENMANWIVAAIEPIVANLALRESCFRREPLREEFRDVVGNFVGLLAKRERKSKKTVGGQCWRTVCSSPLLPMMAEMRSVM